METFSAILTHLLGLNYPSPPTPPQNSPSVPLVCPPPTLPNIDITLQHVCSSQYGHCDCCTNTSQDQNWAVRLCLRSLHMLAVGIRHLPKMKSTEDLTTCSAKKYFKSALAWQSLHPVSRIYRRAFGVHSLHYVASVTRSLSHPLHGCCAKLTDPEYENSDTILVFKAVMQHITHAVKEC